MVGGKLRAKFLDRGGIAESIQYDVCAFGRERGGDAEADAAARSRDQRGLSFEHDSLQVRKCGVGRTATLNPKEGAPAALAQAPSVRGSVAAPIAEIVIGGFPKLTVAPTA